MIPETQFALSIPEEEGKRTFLLDSESTTIGRSPDQDLVLPENFVSRRHALIRRMDGGYELIDQHSSHGTYLNGVCVQRVLLKVGDVLQFGSIQSRKIRFCKVDENDSGSESSLAQSLLFALSSFSQSKDAPAPVREMEQLGFLISAARQLNAGGGINDILRALLQLTIKLMGVERGFVFLREGEEMRLALGIRADGSDEGEDSRVSRHAMNKAIERDSKFYVSDTLRDEGVAVWDSVVANSIRSICCIPLRKHISPSEPDRLLGVLYLDSQLSTGHLKDIDHEVLDTIATEAATLLHNALLAEAEQQARRAAEELAVAATIHAGLMSVEMPRVPYALVQAKTIPCHAIGGDFFDALVLDDCIYAVVADVSGKGVPASIVAATLQGIIHAQLLTRQSLPEIADLVNRFLCTRKVGKYATMVLLKVCPDGMIEYVNCGHVPPIVVGPSGERRLEATNLVVGLISGAQYTSAQAKLNSGERIILATDGITEAENSAGEQFGDAGLDSALHLGDFNQIFHHLAIFLSPNEAQDDWTLLDLQYLGETAEA